MQQQMSPRIRGVAVYGQRVNPKATRERRAMILIITLIIM